MPRSPSSPARLIVVNTLRLRADVDAAVGSSIIRNFGPVISALPMTTFCWLPPDKELTSCAGSATLMERFARSVGVERVPSR